MSRNARIEEISDSDSDPEDMDPTDFDPTDAIIHPANIPKLSFPPTQQLQPQFRAPPSAEAEKERYKKWQSLYPIYFDAARSRAEGRRVAKSLAVRNPLAREIADAVSLLGLNVVFEPGKMHPKDWANPGRVRILLKEDGVLKSQRVTNKHHLYILVAKYLQAHPTTSETPTRAGMRIQGMPVSDKPIPPPAVPRGWKMGTILPLHSPALSGGGVSENIFKEMMQEMGGGGQLESSGGGPSEGKKKKEKRKVIRA